MIYYYRKYVCVCVIVCIFAAEASSAAEDIPIRKKLEALPYWFLEDKKKLESVRQEFPIDSETIAKEFSLLLSQKETLDLYPCIQVALKANGIQGLVWILQQLDASDVLRSYNVMRIAAIYQNREPLYVCINMLKFTDYVPFLPGGSTEPPPLGHLQKRYCDEAYNTIWLIFHRADCLPKDLLTIRGPDSYEKRDKMIARFQEWWKKSGQFDQQILKKLPSFVDSLFAEKCD